MNFGCQDSRARWRRRSPARSTLFGIFASMSTRVIASTLSRATSVERRADAGPVAAQGALGADGVGALEDPVLPRREPSEDLRLHRLGAGEAEAGLHTGERVGGEAVALLEHQPHLFVPVDVVRGERDQLCGCRLGGEEVLAE